MRKIHLFLVAVLMLGVAGIAQRGTLKAPRSAGNVTGFDVVTISLTYAYNPATNQHELARAKIQAVEGEVLDEGNSFERFEEYPGGFTYNQQASDLSVPFIAAAGSLHRHALNNYGGLKGYPVAQ